MGKSKDEPPSPPATNVKEEKSSSAVNIPEDMDPSVTPDFIYGGPFIPAVKIEPFVNTATPINMQLQGTFKRSFAYASLKDRMPVILTKVIDTLSRDSAKVKSSTGASDDEVRNSLQLITKLKNDLMTNKNYEPLTVDTPEAKRWNTFIQKADPPNYYMNTWMFTECYIYRKLREAFELGPKISGFDPFSSQKDESLKGSMENMCMVADKMVEMLPQSDKDKRKADFITLLKLCLWANKCDLSLTNGSVHNLSPDPFKMILDLKPNVLVDDSGKIADQVVTKAENMTKNVEGNTTFKAECTCTNLAIAKGLIPKPPPPDKNAPPPPPPPEDAEEKPKIPCPSKATVPSIVQFDIVCDNAGYELFTDLCLAHFLISQDIVKRVRFHVKNMAWFVSDATHRDFKNLIDSCCNAQFNKEMPAPPPPPPPAEGEAPAEVPPPAFLTADNLRSLGAQWAGFVQDGTFLILSDNFWTTPILYKDMKLQEPYMYRKLQFTVAILFKGDLNYRKLLGDKNWNPVTGFEASLSGFFPAPIAAIRTVKSDIISGMPKGKFDVINKIDEEWMRKGEYGVIQWCGKAEAFKASDIPCVDYGDVCKGIICPVHPEL